MDRITYILGGLFIGLVGIFISVLKNMSIQKKQIRNLEKTVGNKKMEMEKIADVQEELRKVSQEKEPERKEAPAAGDSYSRLDRLNSLHKH